MGATRGSPSPALHALLALLILSRMGTLTIRNLDDALKTRLRVRAAAHGHSMEEEARMILRAALATSAPTVPIGDAIAAIFAPLGGFDPPALPDEIAADPHNFD